MSNHGISKEDFAILKKLLIEPLKKRGVEVWLYGSRAKGNHKKFSDFDILYRSDQDFSILISQIKEDMEESLFPYKVDLVNEDNLADSYRSSVLRDRVQL